MSELDAGYDRHAYGSDEPTEYEETSIEPMSWRERRAFKREQRKLERAERRKQRSDAKAARVREQWPVLSSCFDLDATLISGGLAITSGKVCVPDDDAQWLLDRAEDAAVRYRNAVGRMRDRRAYYVIAIGTWVTALLVAWIVS